MAPVVSYARPTYQNIITSVNEPINEKEKLTPLQAETQMVWILEACQAITQRKQIKEARTIRIVQNVQDTYFSDTIPPIAGTGTINVSGITITGVTSAGTGTVTNNGTTTINGVGTAFRSQLQIGQVLTVAGESHQITQIQSDTVLITDSVYTTAFTNSAFSYSTTRFNLELVSSALTVGSTITVTDSGGTIRGTMIIQSITDSGNAIAVAPLAADYSGCTFTIDTNVLEIPTRMRNGMFFIDRFESSFHREIFIKPMDYVLSVERLDLYAVYTNYNTPYVCGVGRDNQQRYYLHFYPAPDTTKEITVYSYIKITPRVYMLTDKLTSQIPLDDDSEPEIRMYVEAMTWGWLKDTKMKEAKMAQFYAMVRESIGLNREPVTMKTPYS